MTTQAKRSRQVRALERLEERIKLWREFILETGNLAVVVDNKYVYPEDKLALAEAERTNLERKLGRLT